MNLVSPVLKFFKAFILSALILYPIPTFADEKPMDMLERRLKAGPGLSDLITYAYETSPMIKASRAAWKESLEKYRVDTAYPDPEIVLTYWPQSLADDLDKKKFEAMISQTIPFPGKLSAAGEAVKAEAAVNRFDLDRTVREVMTGIRESFHELLYIREAMGIAKNNQALLEQIRTISETAYAGNRGALIDVMKAQSQSAQSGYDEILLKELEHTETTRLNALLNRPSESPIGPLTAESYRAVLFPLEDIFSLSEKNREENKMAGAEIKKSEAMAKVARFETFPEFKLGLIYESDQPEDRSAASEDMYGVQFGMTLPIRFDKNSGRVEAAKAAVEKTRAMAESRVNETRALVRENYFRMQNAERLIFLYRDKLVPEAGKSIEKANVWNQQGQGSITDYLETQSVWYNFQLALARAKADYGKFLARLEGLAGQSLTKKDEVAPVQDAAKDVPKPRTPLDTSSEDKAFEAQKNKLEALRKDWGKTLASPSRETSFFAPDPDRVKMISNAFTDDAAAGNLLSDGFSLEDFEILVFGRNATIKNAEKAFLATLETYSQASILDDIIRSYSAFNAGIMTGVGNMEDMESIYRKFPFPGILSLKGDIVHEEVKIALMDLEITRRNIMTEARKNYQELIYNAAAKDISRRTLGLLEELESSVTRKYETGQAQIPELTKVKIQKEKMKVEVLTVSEEGLNIEKRLKSFLLLPASARIGTPAGSDADKRLPLPADLKLDDLIEAALKHRQELKKTRIMITRMELMIEMAETEIYPGVTPNLALTENRAVLGTGTMKMEEPFAVTVSASMGSGLPKMPWTNLSEAYLRETRQRLLALKEELKAKEAETAADVRDAWFSVDRAKREAAVYSGEIESLSRLNYTVSSKAYETGAIAFSDTMDAVLLMFETNLTAQRKKADFFIALADLYKTVGISKGKDRGDAR